MKRIWIVRLGVGIAFFLCVWAALVIGLRFGADVGRAEYHNEYVRILQAEVHELKLLMDRNESEKEKRKTDQIAKLAGSAGSEEFYRILSSEEVPDRTDASEP